MKRPALKLTMAIIVGLATLAYAISYEWPKYEWYSELKSPDGNYNLVILRGNPGAPSDFSYSMYIFPRDLMPQPHTRGERVLLAGRWRGNEYLVYSGDIDPVFRWTDPNSVEVALEGTYFEGISLHPMKFFAHSPSPVLFSVIFTRPPQ